MKGIAHFSAGVALASCFPNAVEAGMAGNPLYFLLGGIFGLLPDTLDFKILRFLHRIDMEVVPDPSRPDPALLAQAMADAVERVHSTGRPMHVKIHTSSPGAGLWHRFRITLPAANDQVLVTYDGIVNTSQESVTEQPCPPASAKAPLACRVTTDYMATSTVDILDGPSYSLEPESRNHVVARFIPWHRQWTHSVTAAILASLALGATVDWHAGILAGGAMALHVLLDQVGHMGSNLFFPFTRRRTPGWQWIRSGNPLANFGTVWLAGLIVYWNLARFAPDVREPRLAVLLAVLGFLPLAAAAWIRRRLTAPDSVVGR